MIFFGYISSLVIAVMLAMFYIGNVTQVIIFKIKHKPEESKEIRLNEINPKAPPYFIFETKTDIISKSVKLINTIKLLQAFTYNYQAGILKTYYYTNDGKPPLELCKSALFSRPPPLSYHNV
ncbi:MAG: hypothetical protein LBL90_12380 [Prevotellaceae bacterium]|jgi:hypothetical protein|nr:hypothetical protein [Prevotellaceae bacterium]